MNRNDSVPRGMLESIPASTKRLSFELRMCLRNPWVIVPLCMFALARQPQSQAEVFKWKDGSATWSTDLATWLDEGGELGTWPLDGLDNDALFSGTGGAITLGSEVRVNDITLEAAASGNYSVSGSPVLILEGATLSKVEVASGRTFTINSTVQAYAGFIKNGAGTLLLSSNASRLSDITVNSGTLQVGLPTSTGGNLALRRSDLFIAAGATVSSVGASGAAANFNLWTGGISGSGSLTTKAGTSEPGALTISLLNNARFDGTVTAAGLTLQGSGIQHFGGNVNGVTGVITITTGAGLQLSGSGSNGVLGTSTYNIRGGRLIIDNREGSTGRVDGLLSTRSGHVTFIAGPGGSTEVVNGLNIAGGHSIVEIDGTAGPAALTFASLQRSNEGTVDFRSGDTPLASGTNSPARINFQAPPSSLNGILSATTTHPSTLTTIGYATINGRNFAGYEGNNTSGSLVEITPTPLTAAGGATTNALVTGTAFLDASNKSIPLNSLAIDPQALGQYLEVTGQWNLQTSAFLLRGENKEFEIRHTGTGGISNATNAPRIFHIPESSSSLLVSASLATSSSLTGIIKAGEGLLNLSANNSALLHPLTINAGIVRSGVANLAGGALKFRGGVLEISGGTDGAGGVADLKRSLGAGNGMVNWSDGLDSGDGGFSAFGGNATVNIAGTSTPSTLTWNTSGFVADGHALVFGSTRADSRITLLNNVALDSGGTGTAYNLRTFRVLDNPNSSFDVARIAGGISGSNKSDLLKTGPGTLQLTGTNIYSGQTIIDSGALQIGANDGTGAGNGRLSTTERIVVNTGGSLLLGGQNTFTDRIHDAAPIALDGGTIRTNGMSEYSGSTSAIQPGVGALTLLSTSFLDFGDGESTFAFSDSSHVTWSGTLNILNWGQGDRLFFGTNDSGLTSSQLAKIHFYSGPDISSGRLGTPSISSNGELAVVPEPSTALTAGALLIYLTSRHRRTSRGRSRV